MRLELRTPPGFRFETTVRSHGWSDLAPFRAAEDGSRLELTLDAGSGRALPVSMRPRGDRVIVSSRARVDPATRRRVRRAVSRVLALDLDLRPFYEAIRDDEALGWVEPLGAGRLLRAPTVFEDLVKLVLTTNCTWVLTKRWVAGLVDRFGPPADDGTKAFPTPARLARVDQRVLREELGFGYRAPYVAELARRAARGRPDPEVWDETEASTSGLRAAMLELPGVGPYVAENMLKLLGRPDGLALDSWLRSKFASVYHGGRRVTDRTIARRYRGAGEWAGVALWCDMTADWMNQQR